MKLTLTFKLIVGWLVQVLMILIALTIRSKLGRRPTTWLLGHEK